MMREGRYRNRAQAGEVLAAYLQGQLGPADSVVLALPRGGVPVALEVARTIDAPLDILPVRKLGVPGQPELAMGAIGPDGFAVLDYEIIAQYDLYRTEVAAVAETETAELERQERAYRLDRPPIECHRRTVILVDDGLATGLTMRVAVAVAKLRGPTRVVVGVPVGAIEACKTIARKVDLFVCPLQPREFSAVGQWYQDFAAPTDEDVRACLIAAEEYMNTLHAGHRHRH